MKNRTQLFRSTKNGSVSVWTIWSEENTILIETKGTEHSSPVLFKEEVPKGLASRTVEQQIESRITSRIRVKLDHGYNPDINIARAGIMTNQLNLAMPMLAERFSNIKTWDIKEMMVQPKLDGHRCLITRVGDEYIAYSRRGKLITTVDHILKNLHFPDGYTLDGELYCHGIALQTIASWAKRKQPNTKRLGFWCYDVITPYENTKYIDRFRFLTTEVSFGNCSNLLATRNGYDFEKEFTMGSYLQRIIDKGYEGVILRPKEGTYHIGRRHKDLIKVKQWFDNDYEIKKVTTSKSGLAVLHMQENNGEWFKATAPGTRMQNHDVLKRPNWYIGGQVTIEYPNKTNKGIPFQPIAIRYVTNL